MSSKKINLGDEVQDITAKISGIAIARIEYLDGRIAWFIQPPSPNDKELMPRIEVEDAYIKRVGSGVYPEPKPPIGFHVDGEA